MAKPGSSRGKQAKQFRKPCFFSWIIEKKKDPPARWRVFALNKHCSFDLLPPARRLTKQQYLARSCRSSKPPARRLTRCERTDWLPFNHLHGGSLNNNNCHGPVGLLSRLHGGSLVAKEQTGCLSTACAAAHLTTKPVTVLSIFSAACTAALSIEQTKLLVLKGYGSLYTDTKSQMPKNFWLTWIY